MEAVLEKAKMAKPRQWIAAALQRPPHQRSAMLSLCDLKLRSQRKHTINLARVGLGCIGLAPDFIPQDMSPNQTN